MTETKNHEEKDVVYLELENRPIKPIGDGLIRMHVDYPAKTGLSKIEIEETLDALKLYLEAEMESPTFKEIEIVIRALQAKVFERDEKGNIAQFPQMGGGTAPRFTGKPTETLRIHSRLLNCVDALRGKKDKIKIAFSEKAGFDEPKWSDLIELYTVMNRWVEEINQETGTWILDFIDKIYDAKCEAEKLIGKK